MKETENQKVKTLELVNEQLIALIKFQAERTDALILEIYTKHQI